MKCLYSVCFPEYVFYFNKKFNLIKDIGLADNGNAI